MLRMAIYIALRAELSDKWGYGLFSKCRASQLEAMRENFHSWRWREAMSAYHFISGVPELLTPRS